MTVTELTGSIERVLRAGFAESISVRGEISNFSEHAASGHFYFTLKDSQNCIDCVMWQSDAARLKFQPRGGMELVAAGRLGVYGRRGRYQLYVTALRPIGQGALELAFQQIRAKLEAEGLFSPQRKRSLPKYPCNIVLITSRDAAGLADQFKVLRRFPFVCLRLYAVPVQGESAASKIAAAIQHVNQAMAGLADLILLGRGGGSLEDLWAFNEEVVARAIAASQVPIITGIGHEVDVSIADLVADYHAHTPTEAAQVAMAHWRTAAQLVESSRVRLNRVLMTTVKDARQRLIVIERHETFRRPLDRLKQLHQQLDDRQRQLTSLAIDRLRSATMQIGAAGQSLREAIHRQLRRASDREAGLASRLAGRHPRFEIQLRQNKALDISRRFALAMERTVRQTREKLDAADGQLRALSPEGVLSRGYSITSIRRSGKILRSASEVRPGDKLITRLKDGAVQSAVEDSRQLSLFE